MLPDTHTQKGNRRDSLSTYYITETPDTLKPRGTNAPTKFLITSITADVTKPINKDAATPFKQLKKTSSPEREQRLRQRSLFYLVMHVHARPIKYFWATQSSVKKYLSYDTKS